LTFPILHGLPGSLARAYAGKLALAPILAPVLTVGLIASGVDETVRGFFLAHVPLGTSQLRFGELFFGMLWPIAASYALMRTGYYRKNREHIAAACAVLQAILVAFAMTMALKFATGRPQPESGAPAATFYGFSLENGPKVQVMWPSGHTTESVSAAAALAAFWPQRRKLAALVYGLAALVATVMVVASFHWVSDVVAGVLLAAPIGWSTGATLRKWVGEGPNAVNA
jgi:membrane-associated phospholipid phosphatase